MLTTVSIPDGLPKPFSLARVDSEIFTQMTVSIPDGLPRPFSLEISMKQIWPFAKFQSLMGFPGHLALEKASVYGFKNIRCFNP
jgi:hypothetical protein